MVFAPHSPDVSDVVVTLGRHGNPQVFKPPVTPHGHEKVDAGCSADVEELGSSQRSCSGQSVQALPTRNETHLSPGGRSARSLS